MNKIRDVERLNQAELESGVSLQGSWHWAYRASNYVFVGGLPYDLTEGDLEVSEKTLFGAVSSFSPFLFFCFRL